MKVLLIKTSSLGDIVHTYPVVDYLHKKIPSVQIDWVVEAPFAELVQSHSGINKVLMIATKNWRKNFLSHETFQSIRLFRKELRKESYDVVFDLQGNVKSGLIISQARSLNKVGFGKNSVAEWPNLLFTSHRYNPPRGKNIRQDYLSVVSSYFNLETAVQDNKELQDVALESFSKGIAHSQKVDNLKRPMVMVCPGSAWRNKRLSIETWKAFLILLKDYLNCHFLFIWGNLEEKQWVEGLQSGVKEISEIVDKMSLPLLQNLMEMSDLVIAMDSLPLHLAGTTNTPSFSVFGASSALKYKPLGEKHFALQGKCPYSRAFEKRCPILRTCPTGACIRSLEAVEIFDAFKSWWGK